MCKSEMHIITHYRHTYQHNYGYTARPRAQPEQSCGCRLCEKPGKETQKSQPFSAFSLHRCTNSNMHLTTSAAPRRIWSEHRERVRDLALNPNAAPTPSHCLKTLKGERLKTKCNRRTHGHHCITQENQDFNMHSCWGRREAGIIISPSAIEYRSVSDGWIVRRSKSRLVACRSGTAHVVVYHIFLSRFC